MPNTYPAVIFFDLDETLIKNRISITELFASIYTDFSDQLEPGTPDAFFSVLRPSIGNLWNTMFETHVSPEEQLIQRFAAAIKSLGQHTINDGRLLAEQMFSHFVEKSSNNVEFHHDALETLAQLRNAGYITGIITNGIEALQLGKINQLGLPEKVDHVVVSAQARAHKPHAPVFELALQRANISPNRAWQVGDHATNDVAGAIRVGMSGIFYDPSQTRRATAFDTLEVEPTHTVSTLIEVVDLARH